MTPIKAGEHAPKKKPLRSSDPLWKKHSKIAVVIHEAKTGKQLSKEDYEAKLRAKRRAVIVEHAGPDVSQSKLRRMLLRAEKRDRHEKWVESLTKVKRHYPPGQLQGGSPGLTKR